MLRILHLEDDPVDAALILDLLREESLEAESDRVETLAAFRDQLLRGVHGLILSDYTVPGVDPLGALRLARELRPEVPLIFISGTIGEEQATETLKLGASDYVMKQRLGRLVPAVRRALQEAEEHARRRQAEAALRESEARLNAIIWSAMDAVISIDERQRVVLFNTAAVNMFGVPEREALGQHINRFIPEPFRVTHAPQAGDSGRDGVSPRPAGALGRITGRRANGEEFPIEASIAQTTVAGQTLCTVILRDITERQRADEALRESEQRLERIVAERTALLVEANTNLQTFVYTVAHDLRAPLRAISSFAGIIAEEYRDKLDPEARSMFERIGNSIGQMNSLLNDLIEYSKLGQAQLQLQPVNLRKAAENALALLHPDVQARNAQITIQNCGPPVLGHPATVVLILTNFLSNALKFTRPGVPPRILIREEQLPRNAGRPAAPARMVRVSFEDNGIGIRPEDQPRLFGVFQRLHGAQEYPGTGLGLAIARRGAERMGGRVGMQSEPGKGSRFWLELPAAVVSDA